MDAQYRAELLKLPAEELVNRILSEEHRATLAECKAELLESQVADLRNNVDDLRATVAELRKAVKQLETGGHRQRLASEESAVGVVDANATAIPCTVPVASTPVATVAPVQAAVAAIVGDLPQLPLQQQLPRQVEAQSDARKLPTEITAYMEQYRQWVNYFAAFPPVQVAKTEPSVRSFVTSQHSNSKTNEREQRPPNIVTERCTDPEVLARRTKQIEQAKEKPVYQRYIQEVPKGHRQRGDPKTPEKNINFSRRSWDMQIKRWKLRLHAWEEERISNQLLNTASTAHHNGVVDGFGVSTDDGLKSAMNKLNLNNTF